MLVDLAHAEGILVSPRPYAVAAEPARLPPVDLVTYNAYLSEEPVNRDALFVGYDNGFVIANHGEKSVVAGSVPFLMRVNSWLQLRHTIFDSDGPNLDQNNFSFERLRLSFSGHVVSPQLHYFFQFDGNSDRGNTIVLDYFLTYDLGSDVFGYEPNQLGIKAGKWKVPYSRSRAESGRRLQLTDRATANIFFDLNRSFGAGLYGEIEPLGLPVNWETALFNGFLTGNTPTNRGGGLDRHFGWSLRAYTNPFGDLGGDGEPDLSWSEQPVLQIGVGLASTRVDAEGTSEFSRQRAVDSGTTLDTLLPAGVSAYDVWLYTIDGHLKYHGLSIIAEYYWRYISWFSGGTVPSLFDDGFVLQTGYFIWPEKLELLLRWSRITGSSGALGTVTQSSDEVATGLAWYINGHNAKLVFDISHINGAPVSSNRLDLLPGDAGWLARTQFQLAF